MKNFIEALNNRKGFDFLTDWEKYSELTKDQIRDIAKELVYAIENSGLIESDINDIYETATENLTESYHYEFEDETDNNERDLQFVDTRKNAILGIGDDYGFDEYDLEE